MDHHHKHDPLGHGLLLACVSRTNDFECPKDTKKTVSVTKVVSERPFGPVRLVIGDIRGASRPFGVGRELGSAS